MAMQAAFGEDPPTEEEYEAMYRGMQAQLPVIEERTSKTMKVKTPGFLLPDDPLRALMNDPLSLLWGQAPPPFKQMAEMKWGYNLDPNRPIHRPGGTRRILGGTMEVDDRFAYLLYSFSRANRTFDNLFFENEDNNALETLTGTRSTEINLEAHKSIQKQKDAHELRELKKSRDRVRMQRREKGPALFERDLDEEVREAERKWRLKYRTKPPD
jgi:hypothetical protein